MLGGNGGRNNVEYGRKVKISFILEQATKAKRGSRYISTLSLTSALDGVGGQSHALAALPPGKRPGTHYTGGWEGPRVGLDGCGKSRPYKVLIPGPYYPNAVAIPNARSRVQ